MAEHEKEEHGGGGHDEHAEEGGHKSHGHGGGHGGHEEHEEGVPEWVVSFADNALLQMGFFAILLAMNMGLKAKGPVDPNDTKEGAAAASPEFLDSVIAIREGFNSPVSMDSTRPEDQPLIKRQLEKQGKVYGRQGLGNGQDDQGQALKDAKITSENQTVGFEQGSSSLTTRARDDIAAFARAVKGQQYVIEVRGHVSPFEARVKGRADNDLQLAHRLSFERSMTVTNALVEAGIDPMLIRVRTSGASERATGSVYQENEKRSNQRVEIVRTNEQVNVDDFNKDPNKDASKDK